MVRSENRLRILNELNPWVIGASLLSLLGGVGLLLSRPGTRWEWWHFSTGFSIMRWSVYGAGLAILCVFVGIWQSWDDGSSVNLVTGTVVVLCSLTLISIPLNWYLTARSVPPIHDISTDLENPPTFDAIVPIRKESQNPIEYAGESVAKQQREAYPGVQPLRINQPPRRVFETVRNLALDMGWTIHQSNLDRGRLEATDRTDWFGFRDDIVVRVSSDNSETIVDVRSQSRVGKSDVGTNARRINRFLRRLNERLN